MSRSNRRDHLIDTAIELFCEHGYHATGIDKILKKSGVSKKTLYTHFRSKEELIIAALRKKDGLFRNEFMRKVDRLGHTPQQKIEAIFDVAEAWFSQKTFFGCMFLKVVSEYSQMESPFREVTKQFKQLMRDYFRELCIQMGARNPDLFADQLALILEGAIATSQVTNSPQAAKTAKKIAVALMAKELNGSIPDNDEPHTMRCDDTGHNG